MGSVGPEAGSKPREIQVRGSRTIIGRLLWWAPEYDSFIALPHRPVWQTIRIRRDFPGASAAVRYFGIGGARRILLEEHCVEDRNTVK